MTSKVIYILTTYKTKPKPKDVMCSTLVLILLIGYLFCSQRGRPIFPLFLLTKLPKSNGSVRFVPGRLYLKNKRNKRVKDGRE